MGSSPADDRGEGALAGIGLNEEEGGGGNQVERHEQFEQRRVIVLQEDCGGPLEPELVSPGLELGTPCQADKAI
eukprot:scaffold20358_cov29-Prasinocladus_malaysianus.AAC.1